MPGFNNPRPNAKKQHAHAEHDSHHDTECTSHVGSEFGTPPVAALFIHMIPQLRPAKSRIPSKKLATPTTVTPKGRSTTLFSAPRT
jgi:hypothetical protein